MLGVTFRLTKKEVKEYEEKGYIAVKNPSYMRGTKHCEAKGWIVWAKGKGYVKYYYTSQWAALTSAERDDKDTEVYGREYTKADIENCRQGSLLRSHVASAYAARKNLK